MASTLTLAQVKTSVRNHLMDTATLTWTDTLIEEAIRSSMRSISRAYERNCTLNGLDGAASTNTEKKDDGVVIDGGVAYALSLRASGRFTEATPVEALPANFGSWAEAKMTDYRNEINQVWLRFQAERTYQETWEALRRFNDEAERDIERAYKDAVRSNEQNFQNVMALSKHTYDINMQTAEHTFKNQDREDKQLHDIAIQTAQNNFISLERGFEQAWKDTVRANEQAYQDAVRTAEQNYNNTVLLAKHTYETNIQTAEHTFKNQDREDRQLHDLAIQSAEHSWKTLERGFEQTYKDTVRANEQTFKQAWRDEERAHQAALAALAATRLQEFQESTNAPHAAWDWKEGKSFK